MCDQDILYNNVSANVKIPISSNMYVYIILSHTLHEITTEITNKMADVEGDDFMPIDTVRISCPYRSSSTPTESWSLARHHDKNHVLIPNSKLKLILRGKRFLNLNNIAYLEHYPNLNSGTLFVTFSIPKLMRLYGCSREDIYHAERFTKFLCSLIGNNLDLRQIPHFYRWQVSRIDYYMDIELPDIQVKPYFDALSRIHAVRMRTDTKYLNDGSLYLHSGKDGCKSNININIYNKSKQLIDTTSPEEIIDTIDLDMQESFYAIKTIALQIDDTPSGMTWIRHEVRLLRDALRNAVRKAYDYTPPRSDGNLPDELKHSCYAELSYMMRFNRSGDNISTLRKKAISNVKRAHSKGKIFPFAPDTELRSLIDPELDAWIVNSFIVDRLNLDAKIMTLTELIDLIDRSEDLNPSAKRNMKEIVLKLNRNVPKIIGGSRNTQSKYVDILLHNGLHFIYADVPIDRIKPVTVELSTILNYLQSSSLPEDEYNPRGGARCLQDPLS